jgi:hypothetical protein
MRVKTAEMIVKVKRLLTENNYIKGSAIAEQCHIHVSSVYRIIRLMRQKGIGTQALNKGYILSEFASKRDDVEYLKRLNGRRTSDFISVQASFPFIKKRWPHLEDKRSLGLIVAPLMADMKLLGAGLEAIKVLEDKQGLLVVEPSKKPKIKSKK